jgi:hypothetical protein
MVRRAPLSEVSYREVHVSAESIVLVGEESVLFAGARTNVTFTRIFAFRGGRWWLSHAQWTAVTPASSV